MNDKNIFCTLNKLQMLLLLIGLSIKGCLISIRDKIFLYFHKDYDSIDSKEGRKRLRDAIEKYNDVPIIRLSYQLLYFDSDFILDKLSEDIYTDDEIDMAIALIDYCKYTVKVR